MANDEGRARARSDAHGRKHGRFTVHLVVIALAALAVTFATRVPAASQAKATSASPSYSLSGMTGSSSVRTSTYFQPGASQLTLSSVAAQVSRPDVAGVRAAGAISPVSSFSSGVLVAAAASGEAGAGIKPLADIVDPLQPFVIYEAQPGDSAGVIADKYGIKLTTLLNNNPEVNAKNLIQRGQHLIVPRKDGILHKVGHGETVDKIVDQYDNITAGTVIEYRPNNVTDPKNLEVGNYLLLVGATVKPPPPPPPAPPPPKPTGGGPITGNGSKPLPGSNGRFSYPLAVWHGVSDPFGVNRGGGTYHTGIDLDLYGLHHSNIFSACNGVVSHVEYLTYSYGYHVIVDCGDGWSTLYAHMDQINVSVGQRVSAGTVLGISGLTGFTTGEHLHFEIRLNGAPVNPADYLGF